MHSKVFLPGCTPELENRFLTISWVQFDIVDSVGPPDKLKNSRVQLSRTLVRCGCDLPATEEKEWRKGQNSFIFKILIIIDFS